MKIKCKQDLSIFFTKDKFYDVLTEGDGYFEPISKYVTDDKNSLHLIYDQREINSDLTDIFEEVK